MIFLVFLIGAANMVVSSASKPQFTLLSSTQYNITHSYNIFENASQVFVFMFLVFLFPLIFLGKIKLTFFIFLFLRGQLF